MTKLLLMKIFDPDTYIFGIILFFVLSYGLAASLLFYICRRSLRRWLMVVVAITWTAWLGVLIYGLTDGITNVVVRHEEFRSSDLPAAFDGYRIVQFSDAHVGTLSGWNKKVLKNAIDSINAMEPDLIVFTGDLQNKKPSEIARHRKTLSRLKAKDGIYSVLGNHDYAIYLDLDPVKSMMNLEATIAEQTALGWTVLANRHILIHRDNQSIAIAGMENDGEGRFPQLGDITNTLYGLSRQSFVVMLEHDPTSWRRKILPHSHCQLTLSGHTHGGQVELFGLSLAKLFYKESGGMYYQGDRAINVSTGLGGVVPFRLGVTPEVVVITLRTK